jgi:serine/threonine-protein phosphatase PP1 catalytic subunit
MHGGLSPELQKLEQIENLRRPCDVPDSGLLCDLLWSDPDASSNVSFVLNDFGSLHFNGEKTQEFISCRHINIMTEGSLIHLEQR